MGAGSSHPCLPRRYHTLFWKNLNTISTKLQSSTHRINLKLSRINIFISHLSIILMKYAGYSFIPREDLFMLVLLNAPMRIYVDLLALGFQQGQHIMGGAHEWEDKMITQSPVRARLPYPKDRPWCPTS